MVVMSMLGTMCCSTSVVLVHVGIFMKPLSSALGWSRGGISLALSVGAIAMAAANPFVGRLIDRYGVRPVLIVSLVGYGASTAFLPVLAKHWGILGFYVAYAAIAGIGAGSNVIAYVRILSGWFSGAEDKSRGFALGLASAGVPLGGALTGPIAVLLLAHVGWQGAYHVLALAPAADRPADRHLRHPHAPGADGRPGRVGGRPADPRPVDDGGGRGRAPSGSSWGSCF